MESKDGHLPLTAKLVASYLRHHKVGANQLPDLIAIVHVSLGRLGQQLAEDALTPAVSVRQSVRHDYVVCLDCGYRGKTLRRHIGSRHGLSRAEYLTRWGLRPDHPLTAPAYSAHRSSLAKQLGLGRNPRSDRAGSSTPAEIVVSGGEEQDADHASPRGTTASGSDGAASQRKRTRQRRTRSRSAPPQSEPLATPTAEA